MAKELFLKNISTLFLDIDYCGYGVLPMAIQPQILLTVGKSSESRLRLINIESEKYPEFERTLDEDINIDQSHPYWWNYFLCGLKGSSLLNLTYL